MRVQKTTSPVIWSLQKGLSASWGIPSYRWGRCSLLSLVSPTRLLIAPKCPKAWVYLIFDSKLLSPSVCFNEVRVMTLSNLHHGALKHSNRGQTRKAQLSSPTEPSCKLWTVARRLPLLEVSPPCPQPVAMCASMFWAGPPSVRVF